MSCPTATRPLRARVIGVAVATAPRTAWYVPVSRQTGSLLDSGDRAANSRRSWPCLGPVLAERRVAKVGHDLKAATLMLGRHGRRRWAGLDFDTMIASYLIDPTRSAHSLEDTALEHLGYKAVTEESLTGKGVKADRAGGPAGRRRHATSRPSARICRCSWRTTCRHASTRRI